MKKLLLLLVCLALSIGLTSAYALDEKVVVVSHDGDVKVIPAGQAQAIACQNGMLLKEGSRVITGKASYVTIAFDKAGRNLVKIKENTEVVIKLDGSDKIELVDGVVFALLQKLDRGETFRVRTPCAVCGARGTAWMTETNGLVTYVGVFGSNVFASGINKDGSVMEKKYWVKNGYQRMIEKFKDPGDEKKVPEDTLKKWKKEFGLGEKGRKDKEKGFWGGTNYREKQINTLEDRKSREEVEEEQEEKDKHNRKYTGYGFTTGT